jgi:hypothetical protein
VAPEWSSRKHDPEKTRPDLVRTGNRFSDKIMFNKDSRR